MSKQDGYVTPVTACDHITLYSGDIDLFLFGLFQNLCTFQQGI
jgi:hypothetical protein